MKVYKCKHHGETPYYTSTFLDGQRGKVITTRTCIVCKKERARKFSLEHPIDRSGRYLREKDKILARSKIWKKNNPDKIAQYDAKRRALKMGAEVSDFTLEQWNELIEENNHSCYYCGEDNIRLTQDHVIPLSKHGNHTKSNIVPACQSCNSKKKDKLVFLTN